MNEWCVANGRERGAVVSVETVWQLSQLWYHDRLDKGFTGLTMERVQQAFTTLGLTGAFWQPN